MEACFTVVYCGKVNAALRQQQEDEWNRIPDRALDHFFAEQARRRSEVRQRQREIRAEAAGPKDKR